MKRITLINPQLVLSRNDIFTTGIVYMPAGLAYFAGTLEKNGYTVTVIDAFGEDPNCISIDGSFAIRGMPDSAVCAKIPKDTAAIFVYAGVLASHRASMNLVKTCKTAFPSVPLTVMENSQAATAYALGPVRRECFRSGADYVLTGDPEERGLKLLASFPGGAAGRIGGIYHRDSPDQKTESAAPCIENLDNLPFPSWELFPLSNYWKLNYAHGPLTSGQYLPVITSRGCPYYCNFCVAPATNKGRWRKRSARRVADELSSLKERFGVSEFHFEDLNPTVDNQRTLDLCAEISSRGLDVNWKLCSGTKVETIKDERTVELMAEAGCRYISISPESGSEKVMKAMNKPFDSGHATAITAKAKRCGIYMQACFVLGYPGETAEDRERTRLLAKELVKAGIDEIAVFIITPVPGSKLFGEISGYEDLSQLNFSPSWRKDFAQLSSFRMRLYRDFLLWKLRYHPLRMLKQPINFIFGSFDTKMEMAPYRALHTLFLLLFRKRCTR